MQVIIVLFVNGIKSKIIFICFIGNNQLVWKRISSNKEEFPSEAVLVDACEAFSPVVQQMYLGIVDLQRFNSHGPYGDIVPGYVQRHKVNNEEEYITSIYYAYDGKAIKADASECVLKILTNPINLKLVWLPSKDGKVPENAVQYTFINDEYPDEVYIGRANVIKVIGRVSPSQNCLYFPCFPQNIEKQISEYEVLCIAQD
jgi:hypothetical protein